MALESGCFFVRGWRKITPPFVAWSQCGGCGRRWRLSTVQPLTNMTLFKKNMLRSSNGMEKTFYQCYPLAICNDATCEPHQTLGACHPACVALQGLQAPGQCCCHHMCAGRLWGHAPRTQPGRYCRGGQLFNSSSAHQGITTTALLLSIASGC